MFPGKIAPNPAQPPENYIIMKAPPGTEHWCGDLAVRIEVNSAGKPGFMSEWHPTDAERARIAEGAPVRSFITGTGLPPQSLWVPDADEV